MVFVRSHEDAAALLRGLGAATPAPPPAAHPDAVGGGAMLVRTRSAEERRRRAAAENTVGRETQAQAEMDAELAQVRSAIAQANRR